MDWLSPKTVRRHGNIFFPTSYSWQLLSVTTRATSPAWTFDSTGHFNLTLPNKRWALVHTPPNFDKTQAHPLVLAFHGAVANAQTMEAISNLSNDSLTINGMGIVVVYGEGTTGTNGGNDWQGAPYSSGANDVCDSVSTTIEQRNSHAPDADILCSEHTRSCARKSHD
jgi:poly(3-hydroxybutyrate) depolymerase